MRIIILLICIFISSMQVYTFINQSKFESRIEYTIENQLKILNTVYLDKVDTNFQLKDLENKIKEVKNENTDD